jgi:hypothetical protein
MFARSCNKQLILVDRAQLYPVTISNRNALDNFDLMEFLEEVMLL